MKARIVVVGIVLTISVIAWRQRIPVESDPSSIVGGSSNVAGRGAVNSSAVTPAEAGEAAEDTKIADGAVMEALPEAMILVSVVDAETRPIQGVNLFHLLRRESSLLALTDGEGRANILAASVGQGGALMAQARGYATKIVVLDERREDIVLTLEPEGTVTGHVEFLGGARAGSGIRIVAVPREVHLTWDPSMGEAGACLHGRSGVTDELGGFRIEGLQEGKGYRLEAAGRGAVVRSGAPGTAVTASADGIVLELQPVLGVMLHFSCPDEAWFAACYRPPNLKTTGGSEVSRVDGLERRPGPSLLGVPELQHCEYCRPLLYLQKTAAGAGPHWVEVEGSIPGFEPFWAQIELQPLADNRLPEHTIELKRNSAGLGTLRLVLGGPGADLVAEMGTSAHLALERLPRGQVLEFPLRWGAGMREVELERVPAGNYRWSLAFEGGLVRIPERQKDSMLEAPLTQVELKVGATAEILVPTPSVAFLEVECHTGEGPVPASIELRAYGGGGSRSSIMWMRGVTCAEIPQRVGPLEPGSYGLRLVDPAPISKEVQTVEVEAGAVQEVILVAGD